ncbi:hypothetical protein FGO68_gene4856 [Halteria grandinella]|uniref:Uncharacterized protein n=1 Tax=Halteria grandinella TaxID=5974 RepID=A0A8J8T5P5_HALGN|nr:hypothetical protein FGO68_gene4856 [Halteria grandinella]
MDKKAKRQIIYEPEDAYAADAYRKYLMIQEPTSSLSNTVIQSSKAGMQMRHMIDSSDYYLKNFKATRDSEFSDHPPPEQLDIIKLREQRHAVINPIQAVDQANIQVMRVNRKNKQKAARSRSKKRSLSRGGEGVDDLEAEFETDEDKLIKSLQKKRQDKARFVETVRDRQQRMLEINQKIRQYDLRSVKEEEFDSLNRQIEEINQNWSKLKSSLEAKLGFAEKIHRKHHQEVEDYQGITDNLDQSQFSKKIQRITFQLQTDQRDIEKSAEELIAEREKVKIYLQRAKKDFDEETLKNKVLKKQMLDSDGTSSKGTTQAEKLRTQIDKMREEMVRINNYNIDMSSNPAQAIQKISDPILEVLNLRVDNYEQQLIENLQRKKDAQQRVIDLKNSIFEQKVDQVNFRRRKEELKSEMSTLKEDIEKIEFQIKENILRKYQLAERITQTTEQFKNEASELREELSRVQSKLKEVYQHKDLVEDQALFLIDDRGVYGTPRKYVASITEFVTLAKSLGNAYKEIQDKVLKLDEQLSTDGLYKEKGIEGTYKIGRFAEKAKADTMQKDLDAKQAHLIEQLQDKEQVEEQLAAFGSIHSIYKTFNDVQEDIKLEIKRHYREKAQIVRYLETLSEDFAQNQQTIGTQEWKLRSHQAKFKAVYFLLQEKLLAIKVIEDQLIQVRDEEEVEIGEDVNSFERELIYRLDQDKIKKNSQIQAMRAEVVKLEQALPKGDLELEKIILEKAISILKRYGFKGQIQPISKGAYKLTHRDQDVYLYLKQIQEGNSLEHTIYAKTSLKGDKLKGVPTLKLGTQQETYYHFDKLAKNLLS